MKMRIGIAAALLMLLPCAARSQVTATSGTSATNVKTTMTAPVVYSSEQRHAFEASLTGVASTTDMANTTPLLSLTWTGLPGATYKVLRYSMLSSPPAVLAVPEAGTRYVAELLPGKEFNFRVVAYGSGGAAVDTSAAFHIVVPSLALSGGGGYGGGHGETTGTIALTCTLNMPSNLVVSWTKTPNIDDYGVVVRPAPGQSGSQLVNTTVTGSSFSQNGLPAGQWEVQVNGNYVMQNYPVPGQSTRVSVQNGHKVVTVPVASQTACQ